MHRRGSARTYKDVTSVNYLISRHAVYVIQESPCRAIKEDMMMYETNKVERVSFQSLNCTNKPCAINFIRSELYLNFA